MATPLTYRQWLQMKANDTTPTNAWDANMSGMLLQIVGDDGRLDGYAVGENRAIKGADGQVYYTAGTRGDFASPGKGLMDVNDALYGRYNNYLNNPNLISQANQENQGYIQAGGGGGGTVQVDPDAALRADYRNRIAGRAGDIDAAYDVLFGDLTDLITSRSQTLDQDYAGQLTKAGDQYAAYLPKIESSYSALGAANSTDLRDANLDAKGGFEDTVETIGKNKEKDQSALGQFQRESEARFGADRAAAHAAIASAADTTDVNALRGLYNDIDTNIRQAGVTRATLGTDGSARQQLLDMTADSGRFNEAINALDSILKSSMSGDVKAAAVQAITNSSGLSDDEKKRVQQQYGNVYAEQAAL